MSVSGPGELPPPPSELPRKPLPPLPPKPKSSSFSDLKGEAHTVQPKGGENLSVKPTLPPKPPGLGTTKPTPPPKPVYLNPVAEEKKGEMPTEKRGDLLNQLKTQSNRVWQMIKNSSLGQAIVNRNVSPLFSGSSSKNTDENVSNHYEKIINLTDEQLNNKIGNEAFIKLVDENLSPANARLIKEMAFFRKSNHPEQEKEFEAKFVGVVRWSKNDWAILFDLHQLALLPSNVQPEVAKKLNDRFEIAKFAAEEANTIKLTVVDPQANIWMIKALVKDSGLKRAYQKLQKIEAALIEKAEALRREGDESLASQIEEGPLQSVRQNLGKLDELYQRIYHGDITRRF